MVLGRVLKESSDSREWPREIGTAKLASKNFASYVFILVIYNIQWNIFDISVLIALLAIFLVEFQSRMT